MKTELKVAVAAAALGGAIALAGCASDTESEPNEHQDHGETTGETTEDDHDHAHMDHPADGGPVPEGMTEATEPEYAIGDEVTLTADHMPGMDGATATIVGAYDTYTYSVDYTPTTGGDPVTDHRWVVQEEFDGAGDERLDDGTEVILAADHMEGMDGATASVFSSTDETVYVVDFEAGGMSMTNHKWVVDSEIESSG